MDDVPSHSFIHRIRSLYRRYRNGRTAERFEEEIQGLIDQGAEQGVITPGEGEMIQSIFELGDTIVREIMIPRTSVIGVPVESSLGEILDIVITHGHSRLPIYRGDIDHIDGILIVKDLLNFWSQPADNLLPREIIRPPIFVPESKKIVDLLSELRAKKSHMAVVLDEYGGTAGLVTLEDVIEEIVGDIRDEYDKEEEQITRIDDETFLVDARLGIEDLADLAGIELPDGEYETVGGFLTDLTGRVPAVDEQLEWGDLLLTIRSADERKINQVEIKRLLSGGTGSDDN